MTLKANLRGLLGRNQHLVTSACLVAFLLLVAAFRAPQLFSASGIGSAVIVLAPLVLASLAVTPIVLAGRGGIDLSVGPLLGFLNVTLVAWLVEHGYSSPALVIVYMVGAGVLYQVVIAAIIIYVRIAPIIVTLSAYLVLSGVNLVILDRPSGVAPEWMFNWGDGATILSPVFFVLCAMIALWTIFSRTVFYQQILLTGGDERMAFASGVNTIGARFGAHAVAGIFTAIAALCYTALIGSGDPTQGSTYTLSAIAAVVLGGTSLAGGRGGGLGSILGALSIYLISYVLSTYDFGTVSGFVTQMSTGIVLVLSLLVNSAMSRSALKAQ
ncbi:ABC transporter permease [Mesorhizobium sp. M3A.F.Ca.ET.201.01.1.1]|uniref:ABC transporter permease n=1 Tax=Mesorhizobium sp. M3A.F.Ca.ET.201.01.1.1 TaxID=2563946 RepID=UPI001093F516|nr:ABC transporter permease [Mesorhizobium sp. M3A.F.Ca.ET.201.01.1.1]TGS65575.1 ABC transporter permease [Mesorhizobium sp. M3A.F.Ca.ET.201.01.1.1]